MTLLSCAIIYALLSLSHRVYHDNMNPRHDSSLHESYSMTLRFTKADRLYAGTMTSPPSGLSSLGTCYVLGDILRTQKPLEMLGIDIMNDFHIHDAIYTMTTIFPNIPPAPQTIDPTTNNTEWTKLDTSIRALHLTSENGSRYLQHASFASLLASMPPLFSQPLRKYPRNFALMRHHSPIPTF